MKNLADFKRKLQTKGILVKSQVIDSKGNTVNAQPFAPLGHIQSNAFTVMRDGRKIWCEFGKASDWTFTDKTAIKHGKLGGRLELEFSE
jgi:hypothetical protein